MPQNFVHGSCYNCRWQNKAAESKYRKIIGFGMEKQATRERKYLKKCHDTMKREMWIENLRSSYNNEKKTGWILFLFYLIFLFLRLSQNIFCFVCSNNNRVHHIQTKSCFRKKGKRFEEFSCLNKINQSKDSKISSVC